MPRAGTLNAMDKDGARIKKRAALSSIAAALFLTGMKLAVGLATNSLGILSEAAHSALDLAAALMTYFAVRISDKPADETHHYGHGKVEGFSALLEVVLLLITCAFIMVEAVKRIVGKPGDVEVTVYSFAVMAVSIIVDLSRSMMLYRVAKAYQSQAMEANALHFSSDIWSSLVVIFGLVGYKYLNFPLSDAIAAIAVSILVVVVSLRLAMRTVNVLLDRAPGGTRHKVLRAVGAIPGVNKVENLRLRTSGATTFADMRVSLDGGLSFAEAHDIATGVERMVAELIPGADVLVHVDPDGTALAAGDVRGTLIKVIKAHRHLFSRYHDLHVLHHENRYVVSLHLVMKGDKRLSEVHKVCDHLEYDIKQSIPGAKVTIHVEPPET